MNPSMAAAIFSSLQQWAVADVGLQLFGTCTEAQGVEAEQADRLYGRRFSDYNAWRRTRSGVSAEYRFYRFSVLSLKVVDEAKIGDGVFVSARILRC
jgi:hypothetical protein